MGHLNEALQFVLEGQTLSREQSRLALGAMLDPDASKLQIASLLAALHTRGETAEEIAGAAEGMRAHALRPPGEWPTLVDTCGTGGDRSHSINLSTASAILASAGGVKIAKHGNRSASSQTGSADVLEALGARIEMSPLEAARCLEACGLTFLFAPHYHPAMRNVALIRRELRFPTLFNVLGPLANPLAPRRQVLGVYKLELLDVMAQALRALGVERALVVHGHGGLDEFSLEGPNWVAELQEDGTLTRHQLDARDLGLPPAPNHALRGGDAATNAELLRGILAGELLDARRDALLLNAAAALYVGDRTPSLKEGVQLAQELIDSGAALHQLDTFIAATNRAD